MRVLLLCTGRIASGRVRVGDRIKVLQHEGGTVNDSSLKVTRIEKRAGLGKVQLPAAVAGDVVSLAGAGDAAGIADTIAAPAVEQGLDPGPIDPPTLRWAAVGVLLDNRLSNRQSLIRIARLAALAEEKVFACATHESC